MEISSGSTSEESTTKERRLPYLKQTVADLNDKFWDFVISAEMPFTLVKIPEFITFCKALNPNYIHPCLVK